MSSAKGRLFSLGPNELKLHTTEATSLQLGKTAVFTHMWKLKQLKRRESYQIKVSF